MRRFPYGFVLLGVLAGCAQPGGPAPQAAQPAATAPMAAAGPSVPNHRATTCTVSGFTWAISGVHITPAMTVSDNGFCNIGARDRRSPSLAITLVTPPQHGRVTTSDPGPSPYLRYYPAAGYEGPDSFTVTTGQAGSVTADFAVTVVR